MLVSSDASHGKISISQSVIKLIEHLVLFTNTIMFRWIVLISTVVGMFAYGYVYDNPVALQSELITKYSLSNVEYNLLYSIYSIPNIILPFFSGIVSDKIGEDYLIIFFFGLMVISQLFFTFGCFISYFPLMLFGRFLFGIGSESHALVETPLIYSYFKGKELAFALALHLSMARAGSSLNDYLTYITYKESDDNIAFAMSVGVIILFLSWLGLIGLIIIHRRKKKINAKKSIMSAAMNVNNDYGSINTKIKEKEKMENNKFDINDIKKFDILYWLLTWNCGIMYGIVLSWMNIGNDYLQNVFKLDHSTSNALLMIPYCLAGVLQPFWGYISDLIGKRSQFLAVSSFIFVISHYILSINDNNNNNYSEEKEDKYYYPIVGLIGLGLGYSIFTAVVWPSFALIVEQRAFCTAYGIPTSFYNLVLTLFTIFVGLLTKNSVDITVKTDDDLNKFSNVQNFLLYTSIFTVITCLLLSYADLKSGSRLSYPAIQSKIV